MAAIDLIVLGMVKQSPLSAYDIQKLVEYRNISRWVKISTPSIYKKVIQLSEKGYLEGKLNGEKTVYSLTDSGEKEFERLMKVISSEPIHFFLDFNSVIVNLQSLSKQKQEECLNNIENNIRILKTYMTENIKMKNNDDNIPAMGMAVLHQQLKLAEVIEEWIASVKSE